MITEVAKKRSTPLQSLCVLPGGWMLGRLENRI